MTKFGAKLPSPRITSSRPGLLTLTCGGNVRKSLRRFRGNRFLPDPETYRSVRRQGEHDVGRIVCKGATIPLREPEHRCCADFIGQQVGTKSTRDLLPVFPRIFGGSVRGDDAGNGLGDGRSVSWEIIGRASRIQTIAEIFVELGKQRMDHRKAHAVDGTPPTCVGS